MNVGGTQRRLPGAATCRLRSARFSAAAVAVAMLLLLVSPALVFEYVGNRRERREGRA